MLKISLNVRDESPPQFGEGLTGEHVGNRTIRGVEIWAGRMIELLQQLPRGHQKSFIFCLGQHVITIITRFRKIKLEWHRVALSRKLRPDPPHGCELMK